MESYIKEKKHSRLRSIVLISCVCLIGLLIWIVPLKARSASIRLLADAAYDGRAVTVNLYTEAAYKDLYSFEAVVTNGALQFLLPTEYLPFDRLSITDAEFANAVTGMEVLLNGREVADYVAASLDGTVLIAEASDFTFNEAALQTIERGLSNPWYLRVVLFAYLIVAVGIYCLYGWMKNRVGAFKTILSLGVGLGAVALMMKWEHRGFLEITLNLAGKSVPNKWLIAMLLFVVAAFLIACILCGKTSRLAKPLIVGLYIFVLLFSVGKMVFYAEKVSNTPDETAHIAYVAYLEQTGEWIPKYENMCMQRTISNDTEMVVAEFASGTVNNLRHPPLYYHLIRLSNGITFNEDGTYQVDLDRVRVASMMMMVAALALMLYIGYTRLQKIPLLHMLYGMIITSVPMMTYGASGVNNDTLTILTVTVFFFGILRFEEKKRNFITYLLIGLGISATLLTKMTAGIIVSVAALIVVMIALVREKCWKQLLSWQFLVTIPLYLIAAAFYLYMYKQYGSFQPSLHALNEAYAYSTGFYPSVETRTVKSLIEYVHYFFDLFMQTWYGIASHITLIKPHPYGFLERFALASLWIIPLMLLTKPIRSGQPYVKSNLALYVGVLVTLVMQFVNGYTGLLERGYVGAYQSRYYICAVAMFALCVALLVQKVFTDTPRGDRWAQVVRRITVCAVVLFIAALTYEDFVYFLLHYTKYLL